MIICATFIKKPALEDTLEATTCFFFFPCIFTHSEREIKIIGRKLREIRCILWLHETSQQEAFFSSVKNITFSVILLCLRACSSYRETSVLIDSVDWICCIHIINTLVSFYSLQVAKTWMEFLMDFYNRNRCVAKANLGALLGDVFIKPPIDPSCFFPPLALKKSLLFKTK